MGKLTPHTFKKKLKYKDAVETGYFAHEGGGQCAQAMLEVRVLTSGPPSRVRLLLLIKYKEGVVNKSYFDWTLGLAVRIRPRKGSSTG